MTRIFKTILLSAFLTFSMAAAASSETVDVSFLVTAPDSTVGLQIYLAGNFQGWNPGDPQYLLADLGGGIYELNLNLENNQIIEYKFTRGGWGKVEKGAQGQEISNRILNISSSGIHHLQVLDWADEHVTAPLTSTSSGDVRLLEIPEFLEGRQIRVWLPAEYEKNPDKAYPVLYMFDGQNVFDAATSFAGEWRVDETCKKLIAEKKIRPLIVVAIDNGGNDRVLEYTPWKDNKYGDENGEGLFHLHLIKKHVLPFINQEYRTLCGPENTGLMGSSLGGLMTLLGAGYFEEHFGLFAAMSPSFWWNNHAVFPYAEEAIATGTLIYMDMGGRESDRSDSIEDLRKMKKILKRRGFREGKDLMVVEDEAGKHNETAWSRRLPGALMFLFPAEGRGH